MRKYLLFPGLISILLLTCSKTPEVNPKTPVIPVALIPDPLNAAIANKAAVDNLMLNAYSLLDGVSQASVATSSPWETGTDNWLFGSVAGGDAHKGSVQSDQPEAGAIEAFTEVSTNSYFTAKWLVNITGIHYSNAAINELPLIKDGSVTPAAAKEITAEARFLRGFFELELAKLWRNVPYIDQTAVYDNGYKGVGNPGPIWDKIAADFTAAMDALPATQTLVGRPNKYAAEAFLAKALMFDHKYAQARTVLADLITNGVTSRGVKYALGPYANNFNPSTKNGPESVFAIQATVHDGSNGLDGNAGDMLNFPDAGPASCCGFFTPSFSLVNAFKINGSTGLPFLDTYNKTDLKNDMGIGANTAFTPAIDPVDPRLDWTVGRRGVPYLDWGVMPGNLWTRGQTNGPYVNIKSVYYKAAQATTSEAYQSWASNESTSNNYNAIRFADVILWAAEAEVESGSLQKAEVYVNMIRARAANPTGWVHTYQNPSNPTGGYTTIPAANYKIGLYGSAGGNASTAFTAGGQAYARKAVYFERMIELGMEGQRFFDLQRWDGRFSGPAGVGYMAGVINAISTHEIAIPGFMIYGKPHFNMGKNELYPIPQSQIALGAGKIKQNPGY